MVVCILFKSSFLTNQSKSVTERVSTNHVVVWCHHHSTDHWSHLLTRVNILRYYHRECAAASNEHQSLLIIVRVVKCWSIFFIACMLYDVCMIVIVWYASVEAVSQHSVDGAVSSTLLSTDQWLTHHHTTLYLAPLQLHQHLQSSVIITETVNPGCIVTSPQWENLGWFTC